MQTRTAAAAGVVTGLALGGFGYWLAGDALLAGALALVYGVGVGVAARWEPVARRRGLWDEDADADGDGDGDGHGLDDRTGELVAAAVVALSLGVAVVGVHDGLGLDAASQLLLRLLVVGVTFAGLYLGVAAVLLAGPGEDRAAHTTGSGGGDD